eukprot:scaffold55436_cov37-Phaeocystis_antarctica.AAC.1
MHADLTEIVVVSVLRLPRLLLRLFLRVARRHMPVDERKEEVLPDYDERYGGDQSQPEAVHAQPKAVGKHGTARNADAEESQEVDRGGQFEVNAQPEKDLLAPARSERGQHRVGCRDGHQARRDLKDGFSLVAAAVDEEPRDGPPHEDDDRA